MQRVLVACVCSFSIACASTSTPPRNIPTPRVKLAPAAWDPPLGERVQIRPNGNIYEGDKLVLIIDTKGRIFDARRQPLAQLSEDGYVLGPDELTFGHVGPQHASFHGGHLWLSIARDGQVTFLDTDGKRTPGGIWHGCDGPMLPTCTAVTHALALRPYLRAPSSSGQSGGTLDGSILVELAFKLVVTAAIFAAGYGIERGYDAARRRI